MKKTPSMPTKTASTPTKTASMRNINLGCFVAMLFFVANLRTFLAYNLQAKNCCGVKNYKYEVWLCPLSECQWATQMGSSETKAKAKTKTKRNTNTNTKKKKNTTEIHSFPKIGYLFRLCPLSGWQGVTQMGFSRQLPTSRKLIRNCTNQSQLHTSNCPFSSNFEWLAVLGVLQAPYSIWLCVFAVSPSRSTSDNQ